MGRRILRVWVVLLVLQWLTPPVAWAEDEKQSICSGAEECGRFGTSMANMTLGAIAMYGIYFLVPEPRALPSTNVGLLFGTDDLKGLQVNIRALLMGDQPWTLDSTSSIELAGKKSPAIFNYSIGPGVEIPLAEYVTLSPSVRFAIEQIENFGRLRFGPELNTQILYAWNEMYALSLNVQTKYTEASSWKTYFSLHHRYSRANNRFMDSYVFSIGSEQDNFLDSHISFVAIAAGF